jgi:transcriptional antiterminator RfaH
MQRLTGRREIGMVQQGGANRHRRSILSNIRLAALAQFGSCIPARRDRTTVPVGAPLAEWSRTVNRHPTRHPRGALGLLCSPTHLIALKIERIVRAWNREGDMTYRHGRISWFLAQCKPNSHQIAQRNLARQGFPVFLPLQESTSRARGQFFTQLRPLFPGYLFVKLDIRNGPWRAVNSTLGVTRLVSLGAEPTPVPRELVDELRQRCNPTGRLQPALTLLPGDQVTFATGPFAELVATIERIAPDRRVWVLLELMGQQIRAAVPVEQLQPA